MGYFTWILADKANRKKLDYGKTGYIAEPDGGFIKEEMYDGYGIFNGRDVYEIVVDWNRQHLDEIFDRLDKKHSNDGYPEGSPYRGLRYFGEQLKPIALIFQKDGQKAAQKEVDKCIREGQKYFSESTAADWKREIGITIACWDEDNKALPYPIKIAETDTIPYDRLPSSKSTQ